MRWLLALVLCSVCARPLRAEALVRATDIDELAGRLIDEACFINLSRGTHESATFAALEKCARCRADLIPALLPYLDHPDYEVMLRAVVVLDAIGAPAADALPAIAEASSKRAGDLAEPSRLPHPMSLLGNVRRELAADPSRLAVLEKLLRESDPMVRHWAAETIQRLGAEGRSLVPSLVRAMEIVDDEQSHARVAILCAISRVGTREDSIEHAVKILDHRPSQTYAVTILCHFEAYAELRRLLEHRDIELRLETIRQAGDWPRQLHPLLPALRRQLAEDNVNVRLAAARAIWRQTADAADILPVLQELLGDPESTESCLPLVEELGPDGFPLLESLLAAACSPQATLQFQDQALRRIADFGPNRYLATPRLIEIAGWTHGPERLRGEAAAALEKLGGRAADAVPTLLHLVVHEESPRLREAAMRALGRVAGEERAAALPVLLYVLEHDKQSSTILAAAQAVRLLDPASPAPAAQLGRLLGAATKHERAIVKQLIQFGPDAAPAAEGLVQHLASTRQNGYVIIALTNIGEPALPALRVAASSDDELLRSSAASVIERIETAK
jgi:hypothetical protein